MMKVEIRNNKVVIDGYVNAVERFSKPLRKKDGTRFIEKIMPSVFQRALDKNNAVKVLVNHNYDREVANTKDGTATLYEDNIGLRAIVEIEDADTIEKAKEKKLRGWSFGFICIKKDEITNEEGIIERIVREIELKEVSIIDDKKIPAYIGTSIEMRDGDIEEIEFRYEEFDENSFSNEEVSNEKLTERQKRELLSSEYINKFPSGWLEDYDDGFIYGTIGNDPTLYKTAYTVIDGKINIDTTNQIKVIRGGYKEVRESPEQQDVVEIDYSKYEERIRKLKEEEK